MAGPRRAALAAFAALSLTSLFADMAYEGARSVLGPYLRSLGAALVVAGAVSVGDLVSYAFRFAGGELAHRLRGPRAYWGLTFLGYAVNLLAVPLLALAGSWWLALALVLAERAGKGLRAAPRDAILAEVSSGVPRGLAFSLHELADQAGAVSGALVVAAALRGHGYRHAYALLAVPAALALASLLAAYLAYPTPREALRPRSGGAPGLPRGAARLALAAGLGMAALMHWAQASYRLSASGVTGVDVALLYSLAMLSDAALAVPLGLLYDRRPRAALALGPALSASATLALLAPKPTLGATLWGAAMSAYETAYRAAAAGVPQGARARAYAALYASMGAGWALGNLAMSLLPPGAAAALAVAAGLAGAAAALAPPGGWGEEGYYLACRALWGQR
ncbi:MAG: MFS transporter [Desulfurococcales archaeon]|nr:MFS transporter [Desulfurococcales archaeon]